MSNWHSSSTIATLDLRPRKLKAQGKEESSKWEDWEPKIATGEITRPCAVQFSTTLKNVYQKFSNLEVLNQLKSYFNITKTHSYINVVLVTEPWPSTGLTSCFFLGSLLTDVRNWCDPKRWCKKFLCWLFKVIFLTKLIKLLPGSSAFSVAACL